MTSLPTTGERTVPGAPREAYWFARHDVVYRWLSDKVVPGERWLDAGAGEGYGSSRFADAGALSFGAELDARTAAHAAERYTDAAFVRANLVGLPFRAAAFDVVVSLQVIEHMWDVPRYLRELVRVCRAGGTVVVSTPNRAVFSLGLARGERPANPFHVEEFDATQLAELLDQHGLTGIELYGVQHAPRLTDWERLNGSLVAAQIEATATDQWPPHLDELVATVTPSDFVIASDAAAAQDLLAIGRPA